MTEARLLFKWTCACGHETNAYTPDELHQIQEHVKACKQFREQDSETAFMFVWILNQAEKELRLLYV
jgi:hypothetical protein